MVVVMVEHVAAELAVLWVAPLAVLRAVSKAAKLVSLTVPD